MRLKEGVFLHQSGGEYLGVTRGKAAENFNGLIRNNRTANDIFELLQDGTTEGDIVRAMCGRYDAPEGVVAADVRRILGEIREAGLLDE